jgi:hypothetical protein
MNRKMLLLIFSVAAVLVFVNAKTAFARVPDSKQRVVRAIRLVRSARGANAQVDAAQELRNIVLATDSSAIDDETVHSIASLLEFKNEAVRYWIAEALGHFGARAKFAVPRLRAILDERECMIAETSSVSMIRDTLERIGEPAPERKCGHYILPK